MHFSFRLRTIAASVAGLMLAALGLGAAPLPAIKVADNQRYFVKADGTPFFWLADTAWGIFNHPTPAEVDLYLDDRAAKGFTVIQGVIALWDYNSRPNPDGQLPFLNRDFGQINEAFYKNADAILDKVEAHGMYMAILPYWVKNSGNLMASGDNPQKLKAYCKFLAQRYAGRNVFWVLGGDATAVNPNVRQVTDLMAEGLLEGAKAAGVDHPMISYHPTGRQSSSFWFQSRPWLSYDSIQSGHTILTTNFLLIGDDIAKTPVKPTLDMEPGYENITNNLVRDNPNAPRIQAADVRRSAYLAVFAGAAGHTYGNGEVYEFWSPEKGVAAPAWAAKLPFRQSLLLPGSGQVQYLRYLIESRPSLLREPNLSMIVGEVSSRATERTCAMRASDGSYAFVYTQQGKPVTVGLETLTGTTINAWWYDPRTGKAQAITPIARARSHKFIPPAGGEDWVLVLDDAAKAYSVPGARSALPNPQLQSRQPEAAPTQPART
jgi:hypothetical protein